MILPAIAVKKHIDSKMLYIFENIQITNVFTMTLHVCRQNLVLRITVDRIRIQQRQYIRPHSTLLNTSPLISLTYIWI